MGVGLVLSAYLYDSSTPSSSRFSSPSAQKPSPDFGLPSPLAGPSDPPSSDVVGLSGCPVMLTVLMLGGLAPRPTAAVAARGPDVEETGPVAVVGEVEVPPEFDREGTRSESEVDDELLVDDRPRVVFSSLDAWALTGSCEMGVWPVEPETGGRNACEAAPEGAAFMDVLLDVWSADVFVGATK